jgi:heme/copper-type cytochrome/quinol oxidase subunit 3
MEVINNQDNKNEAYEMARKKVKKIKNFYVHLLVFVIVNTFIIVKRYTHLEADEHFFSFRTFSTAFFWGIGLAAHGFSVFVPYFMLGKDWEDRKINEYMNKGNDQKWE